MCHTLSNFTFGENLLKITLFTLFYYPAVTCNPKLSLSLVSSLELKQIISQIDLSVEKNFHAHRKVNFTCEVCKVVFKIYLLFLKYGKIPFVKDVQVSYPRSPYARLNLTQGRSPVMISSGKSNWNKSFASSRIAH